MGLMSIETVRTVARADDRDINETICGLPAYALNIPDGLNAVIMVIQVAAIFTCFRAASMVSTRAGIALVAGAFASVMVSVYSILHEAEHGMLFTNRVANMLGGVVAALFFGAPFHLLRQGHIGHHLRNRSDDEAFDLWFEGESPVWKWMQWIGVLTGLFYLTILIGNIVVLLLPFVLKRKWFGFDRPSAAFMDALNPRYRRVIRLEACCVLVMHALIVRLMDIALL